MPPIGYRRPHNSICRILPDNFRLCRDRANLTYQQIGKENNWETEETMERATVTLETFNGPNGPTLDVYDDDDN
jgi:hypothetical protein